MSLVADGVSENSCVRCDEVDHLLGSRAMRRSINVKEHQGVWERLVELCSALHETETGTITRRKMQDEGDPVSLPCQAEGSSLKE